MKPRESKKWLAVSYTPLVGAAGPSTQVSEPEPGMSSLSLTIPSFTHGCDGASAAFPQGVPIVSAALWPALFPLH